MLGRAHSLARADDRVPLAAQFPKAEELRPRLRMRALAAITAAASLVMVSNAQREYALVNCVLHSRTRARNLVSSDGLASRTAPSVQLVLWKHIYVRERKGAVHCVVRLPEASLLFACMHACGPGWTGPPKCCFAKLY